MRLAERDAKWVIQRSARDTYECRAPVTVFALMRHHECTSHSRAVLLKLKIATGPSGKTTAGAPPFDHFYRVWKAGDESVEDVGCRQKLHQIRACIFDVLRSTRRDFLRGAETITLIRDESKGFLMMRLLACDRKFRTLKCLPGLRQTSGSYAFYIDSATPSLIGELATPVSGTCDEGLLAHIHSRVGAICVDSPSN